MPIFPLQQFEADLAQDRVDREAYERLSIPKTIVVRFGAMKMVGEFPFHLNVKPGCGTKMVARTHRGTELAEMLTSTCPNAGCSKSVTRKEMLEYIENSGGKDYPYFNDGSIIRIATTDDLNEQRRIEGLRQSMQRFAQEAVARLGLQMKVIEAEPILGGERLTFFYTAEDRVDFRELVSVLSAEYPSRIEMRQVGARDEARLIADYEKCGQHCCCKQFLKVLRPISMKSAKIQKATLDPLKISGRCGRLMCCLRYEDETYDSLRKRLPKMKTRVTTPEGPGMVIDAQILTQLVLVVLDADDKRIAVPLENISLDAPPYSPPPERRDMRAGGGPGGPGGARPGDGRAPGRGPMNRDGGGREARPPATPTQTPAETPAEDPLRGMDAEEIARKMGGSEGGRDENQARYAERSQHEASDRPREGERRDGRREGSRGERQRDDRSGPRDRRPGPTGGGQPRPARDGRPNQQSGGPRRERDAGGPPREGDAPGGPRPAERPDAPPGPHGPRGEAGSKKRRRRKRRGGGGGGSGTPGGSGGPPGPRAE